MKEFMMIWANSTSVKYINYHFTLLGEILDYLDQRFPGKVDFMDADAENFDHGDILKQLIKEDYKVVVFYVSTENVKETIVLADVIRSIFPDIKLIGYGPLTVLIPTFFVSTPFDAIYSDGDYERAIESFFKYSIGLIPFSMLEGIKLIKDDKLLDTKKGSLIDLKELGFPRIERLPIRKYQELNKDNKINLTLSRGCPFACPHCLVQKCEGHVDRRRDLDKLKAYLTTIYPKYKEIKIFSPSFTLDKRYVYDFCKMVREYFPKLKWDCATRVDLIDDKELLKTMAKSGCIQITLGIETLSPEELKAIGKKYDLDKLEKTVSKITSSGITLKACIILGIKDQTEESLRYTLDNLTRMGAVIRPMIYTPYHELKDDMDIDTIESFNRKFFNDNDKKISNEKLVRLSYDINNYKNILS